MFAVERLLNETNINVYIYNGQLDSIVNTLATYNWVNRLKWPGREFWVNAPRNALVADGIIQGYYKTTGSFSMYWVYRAGQMVPVDNPPAMHEILRHIAKSTQLQTNMI